MSKSPLDPTKCATLVDVLRWRALHQSDRRAYTFLLDGETEEAHLTYGELDLRARAIGSLLQNLGASTERVLLLYPAGLEYIAAFFGCLYAGAVAVPSYPPRLNRPDSRLQAIAADAQASVVLTTTQIMSDMERRCAYTPNLAGLHWIASDDLADNLAAGWREPVVDGDTLAFLQYTSGSTALPKGVMVSHGNLLYNLRMIEPAFAMTEQITIVNWLPLFHDMGLIGNVFNSLYVGATCILMEPTAFLYNPVRWLQAISRYRAHFSGGPNFAYELCASQITPEQREVLDLSTWQVAFNGSEPVRHSTLERFASIFEPCGFRREAFRPCYGLAEATLFVSNGPVSSLPIYYGIEKTAFEQKRVVAGSGADNSSAMLVGCGQTWLDEEIVIVDPDSLTRCPPDGVGEIWIAGPHVAQGYWNKPEETERTFGAYLADTGEGPFLRTGDLGFLKDGELFIAGRLKDLIIIRGLNHYPQDIELTVEQCHPALRRGCGAAFSVDVAGEERLVVAQEVKRTHLKADMDGIVRTIRQAISREHDLDLYAVVLLQPMSIPKTSSGKIQRQACRKAFLDGDLRLVGEWMQDTGREKSWDVPNQLAAIAQDASVVQNTRFNRGHRPVQERTAAAIQDWLVAKISQLGGVKQDIDVNRPFVSQGLSSISLVRLASELENWLGCKLSPVLAYDYPTIKTLAVHLAGETELAPSVSWTRREARDEPIAVVGMACRFPRARTTDDFWRLLRDGIDAVQKASPERWAIEERYGLDLISSNGVDPQWGGFLERVSLFDFNFFGISPTEAASMDPQHRLLLEVAWEALENAGQLNVQLAGSQAGVFVGISSSDYAYLQFGVPCLADGFAATGNAHSIAANRLSYLLNLCGPSIAIDTACSSSLVAVHWACRSLRSGEIDLALAGGVNLLLNPQVTLALAQAGMLATDGKCKTFDASANGYVRGEGCGMVVLKRLSDARASNDNVLALIRGTAVNHDGASNGLTAPNGAAQQVVIRAALVDAGVHPALVSYVETHGTGTPLGDPIEVQALQTALVDGRSPAQVCGIGSVKTNIGHLEAAAGIAGLIKAVLSLQHGEIPPHLHLRELNPHISLSDTPFFIPTERQPWPSGTERRIAGVSSFGFGGTNAHVVVEQAPCDETPNSDAARPVHLLALSAKTERALDVMTKNLATHLRETPTLDIGDVAYTLHTGRQAFDCRRVIICRDLDQAVTLLEAAETSQALTSTHVIDNRPVAFMFPGLGNHYVDMAAGLYQSEPIFRQCVDYCSDVLQQYLDIDLREALFSGTEQAREEHIDEQGIDLRRMIKPESVDDDGGATLLNRTWVAQPAVFVIEYAMAQLLLAWGIYPHALIGHSIGEYIAACVSGIFSLDDALLLVAKRAQLIDSLPQGSMLAVFLEQEQVAALLSDSLSLSAVNAPVFCTVAGPPDEIEDLKVRLMEQGIACRHLPTTHAFHSRMMEPITQAFSELVSQVQLNSPRIPCISNVTGTWMTNEEATDPLYWIKHLRQTVRFSDGIKSLLETRNWVFVEAGPGQSLVSFARSHTQWDDTAHVGVASLRYVYDQQPDETFLLNALGKLWLSGVRVDWEAFYAAQKRRRIPLPTYPFEREHCWLGDVEQNRAEKPLQGTTLPSDQSPSKCGNISDWFFTSTYQQIPPSPATLNEVRHWLVFADACGLGSAVSDRLRALNQKVVVVVPGETFEKHENSVYKIDPENKDHYIALIQTLDAEGRLPDTVTHLWSVTPDDVACGADVFDQSQVFGYYSLLSLTQALIQVAPEHQIHVGVVANGILELNGQDRLYPEKATLLGPCKVAPQEHANITCTLVDVQLSDMDTWQGRELVDGLIAELAAGIQGAISAYRGHRRWVQSYIPMPLGENDTPKRSFRNQGVYLIVGGLGRVGYLIGQHLARVAKARLILSGRTALPPRDRWPDILQTLDETDGVVQRIRRVQVLESLGAQVVTVSADVADEAQMQTLVTDVYERFGQLNGVIYTAGLVRGPSIIQPIAKIGHAESEMQFYAKARGLYVLKKVLANRELDFCVLVSTSAVALGGLGYVAYAAANAFMDTFAAHCNRTSAFPWFSVGWDPWPGEMGLQMALNRYAMTPEEAQETFRRVVCLAHAGQVLVVTGDLQSRIDLWIKRLPSGRQQTAVIHKRPAFAKAYVAPRNETEQAIARVWAQVLGLEKVGIHDGFFDWGANSLLAMQIVNRINRDMGIELTLRTFFENPTVESLAAAIDGNGHTVIAQDGKGGITERLYVAFPTERHSLVENYLREEIANKLGTGARQIVRDGGLPSSDSEEYSELVHHVNRELGLQISPSEAIGYSSVRDLAKFVLDRFDQRTDKEDGLGD